MAIVPLFCESVSWSQSMSLKSIFIIVVLPTAWHFTALAILGPEEAYLRQHVDVDSIRKAVAECIDPIDRIQVSYYMEMMRHEFLWRLMTSYLPIAWFVIAFVAWTLAKGWSRLFPSKTKVIS